MFRSRLLTACAIVLSLATRQAFSEGTPGVTDTEILLGNHSVQSGPFSIGGAIQRTIKAYFETINEHGGVYGRKIVFLMNDSGGSRPQALAVLKKQVEVDGVFAVVGVGPAHSAAFRYLRSQGVPDLWIADPSGVYTTPALPTVFSFGPTYESQSAFYGQYTLKHWPGKKIGVLYADTDFGKSSLEAFKKTLGDKAQIVATVAVDITSDPNAKAQVLELKRAGAEVVLSALVPPIAQTAVKFGHEQGYQPQWLMMHLVAYSANVVASEKDSLEGVISSSAVYLISETDKDAVIKHIEFMRQRLPNESPATSTLLGQAIAETMVETLIRAGKNPTRKSLLEAAGSFKDWKCTVCRSVGSISPDNHLLNTTISLVKAQGGRWVPLKD
jgi:branched-chain amino acid transport system substrate-binding protein